MNIIDYCISHARVILGILIFVIVAGASTYITIPKEAAPDVNIPIIYISLSQKGISANDSERLLIQPIEDEVKTVEGIKEIRSTAYTGGGNVLLEFDPGFDSDKAMSDVREKGGKVNIGNISKKLGSMWAALTTKKRDKYVAMNQKDKLRYQDEMEAYKN